jgi:class 3 adenylate cyclase
MSDLPAGTVTLLFTDIEGSTALLKRLDDGWPAVLERQRTLLREAIDEAGGLVVDCQGDAMFAVFRSARAGVAAAAAAQTLIADEAWPGGTAVRVRMALHSGEPHRTEDVGYTGIDVVRGARLCAAAHGGQVLLTEVARLLSGAETVDLGTTRLRDMDDPERVHQLSVPGLRSTFPPLRTDAASQLETFGHGGDELERRIERAEATLERRINEHVAEKLERVFDDPFKPDRWFDKKKKPR